MRNLKAILAMTTRAKRRYVSLCLLLFLPLYAVAQPQLNKRYDVNHPVVIIGDWDKPPYEFLNDNGEPAGSNIDVMSTVMNQLGLPYKFVLKEWGSAIKAFERGEADLILANARRYKQEPYYYTRNIINYNKISAATTGDTTAIHSLRALVDRGLALKTADYSVYYFRNEDSTYLTRIEFQSPKVALTGVIAGDYQYFVWGEEPLKWKIKELNLEGIKLAEVNIPISEIHVIGRDQLLIDEIDDKYSRLKQSGEIERMNDKWFHPDRITSTSSSTTTYIILSILLLAIVLYLLSLLARAHAIKAKSSANDLNNMMYQALHMGNFYIMQYDIANDQLTNRYGNVLPVKQMTLEQFITRIHPNEQEDFRKKIQLMLNGRERKTELHKRWNAGTPEAPKWLILHGHALVELDEEGKPAYIINSVHDITHDEEEDRITRELEQKLEVLAKMPLIATSFYSSDGWLMSLNQTMKDLCGFDNADNERFWWTVCMFDIPLFRNAYSPGERDTLMVCQRMEYPELGIDRSIEFFVIPVFNDAGEITCYINFTRDISDVRDRDRQLLLQRRKISETNKQIQAYEKQLHYILANSNTYVWHLDFEKRTIVYSRSMKHPEYTITFDEYYDRVCEEEKEVALHGLQHPEIWDSPFSLDRHFRRPLLGEGSSPRFYNVSGIPVKNEQGKVIGVFGLLRDITEFVEKQQRLKEETRRAEESGQQKSMFLASMTHELRTPLNSIVGFSDLLRTVDTPEERGEFIRIIRNHCDILLRLINDILEASTLIDGPQNVVPHDVDFAPAFDHICQSLELRVQDAEGAVEFIKDNPYRHLPTTLDIGRIEQVITNFVTNAVKYTKQGHIRVGYAIEDGGLRIYCEDTGVGIPEDKLGAIFERFVKLDDFVQGTGLGLSICKSIAEWCNGHVGVESEVGTGSTFWIWIPCNVENAEK